MTVDRLIPSVEDAVWRLASYRRIAALDCPHQTCRFCREMHAEAENAALALDMALAQASDRRRAADDELRRSVAW